MPRSSVIPKEDNQSTAVRVGNGAEWQAWANCIAALGSAKFTDVLLSALNATAVADHLSFFRITPGVAPTLVGAESRSRRDVAANAGRRYIQSLHYRFDPNTPRMGAGAQRGDGPLITRLLAKDIDDDAYRQEIYEHFGLEDRVSILGHLGPVWHIISLYRDRDTGPFTPSDEAAIAARAPLISQLAARQLFTASAGQWSAPTLPPIPLLERMVRQLGAGLSNREIEVCAHALQGKTSEAISLDLEIKESTVATLRKRAYGKLRISTLNELFALCLSAEAGSDPAAL